MVRLTVPAPCRLQSLTNERKAGALEACGRTLDQADAMCLCMSGVDSPADAERLTGLVQRWVSPSADVLVTNDAVGALAGGTGGRLYG